jgi:hypothetical protein
MKTGKSRFDDTVEYIRSIGRQDLADHLVAIVTGGGSPSQIGQELTLGDRSADEDDAPRDAETTRRRRALRALLLCQRVYFSELWAQLIEMGGTRRPRSFLETNWKATSLAHWRTRSTDDIINGIATFCVTQNDASAVAKAAEAGPLDRQASIPDLTLTRDRSPFPGSPAGCYASVMAWLFKGGLVSYRWFMRHQTANNEATLRAAFGPGREIWPANRPFDPSGRDNLPRLPRGQIVHLYVNTPQRWKGHWLVNVGNGMACGCNNDTEGGRVNRDYSNRCSLNSQFYFGYKHPLRGSSTRFEQGIAEVIDPFLIPGRL